VASSRLSNLVDACLGVTGMSRARPGRGAPRRSIGRTRNKIHPGPPLDRPRQRGRRAGAVPKRRERSASREPQRALATGIAATAADCPTVETLFVACPGAAPRDAGVALGDVAGRGRRSSPSELGRRAIGALTRIHPPFAFYAHPAGHGQ
jgi:hypothetical protein